MSRSANSPDNNNAAKPLLNSRVAIPDSGYGRDDAIDINVFAKTMLSDEGKLFTKEFASRAYHALYHASLDDEDLTVPLGLFRKECLWIKAKMETLDVKNDDKNNTEIIKFLSSMKGIFDLVKKDIDTGKTLRKESFLAVIQKLMEDGIAFVKCRRPDLNLKAEVFYGQYPLDNTLTVPANPVDFKMTALSDTFLFTKAFLNTVIKELLDMVSGEYLTYVSANGPLPKIKNAIETAKTADDIVSLVNIISDAISEANQKNDFALSGRLQGILKSIGEYIATTHPEISEEISTRFRQYTLDKSKASAEQCIECCWMMCCGVNATLQLPLNILWISSVIFLGMPQAMLMSSFNSHDFGEAFCFPYERRAIQEGDVHNCCLPIASTISHYRRYGVEDNAANQAADQVGKHVNAMAIMRMK